MNASARRNRKASATTSRRDHWRDSFPFLLAALLLSASWAWARWAPIRRVPEYEIEEVSFGINLLIASAVPWLLQWAALTAAFLGLQRVTKLVPRGCVLKGASVPLIMGAVWWGGMIIVHWWDDPLEAMLDTFALAVQEQLGGGPAGTEILHGVIGPLTGPLMLHGPLIMTGGPFLWAGLSTGMVTVLWTTIAKITAPLSDGKHLSRGGWTLIALLMALWLLPVILRSLMRVLAAS